MNQRKVFPAFILCLLLAVGGLQTGGTVRAADVDDGSDPDPGTTDTVNANASPAVPRTAGWPRHFENNGRSMVVYEPQVDSWNDYATIKFRAAVELTEGGDSDKVYGVISVQADTLVDHDARTVLMTHLQTTTRFPGQTPAQAEALDKRVRDLMPKREYLDVPLDQILAYMHDNLKAAPVDINLNPPRIYYSSGPAILVIYLGPPQFKMIDNTSLMFAVNTNWTVLMDMTTQQYYLLNEDSWFQGPDPVQGPWSPVSALPAALGQLPADATWQEVRAHIPGKPAKQTPKVIACTEPAELIVTNGPPAYSPLAGTTLMYIGNPATPVFLDLSDRSYYYLVAGRWFRAKSPNGPWSAASGDLPATFAKIPEDSPMGYVRASIPKTPEAKDAVLLASVPHKATVNIQAATLDVVYDGKPKFEKIKGTDLKYAVNTSHEVIHVDKKYYCCYQGVWFVAPKAVGPWIVTASVPVAIYAIPPSCPVYNVTYVRVYDSTPTTVVVGYTGGYSGQYVAATGVLMFGAGMIAGAAIANQYYYHYNPCFYSYGCAAVYSYHYGGFYAAGARYYGPYCGAGWGAAYNPRTGTWSRGAYVYGPHGAAYTRQAYNPFTQTYAGHAGATNGYQSWGHGVVAHDGQWAAGGHVSGPLGKAGWAETSNGRSVRGIEGPADNKLVKTGSGNVYAGHDGNVYRKTAPGQWQQWSNHGWQSRESHYGGMEGMNRDAGAREWGQRSFGSAGRSFRGFRR